MPVLTRPDDAMVARLSIRATADTPAVRAGIKADVQRCQLQPHGMPPGSTLVVRRIEAVLDGALGPSMLRPRTWVEDPSDQIARHWRTADRPSRGGVPPSCQAVYFVDQVELIHCLLGDMLTGNLTQWWWTRLRPALRLGETVSDVLSASLVVVPQLFVAMTPSERSRVVAALTPVEAVSIASELARTYGAFRLAAVVKPEHEGMAALLSETSHRSGGNGPARNQEHRHGNRDLSAMNGGVGGSRRRADPTATEPRTAHRMLLWVADTLAESAGRARSTEFANTVVDWIRPAVIPAPAPSAALPAAGVHHNNDARQHTSLAEATPRADASSRSPSAPIDLPTWHDHPPAAPTPVGTATDGEIASLNDRVADRPDAAAPIVRSESDGEATASEPGDNAAYPDTETDDHEAPADPDAAEFESPFIVSNLAGSFLLIAALRRLQLPEILEEDWQLDSQVGGWKMLEVVAKSYLPDGHDHDDDEIWGLLAELDGSTSSPMTQRDHFDPPAEWRDMLPASASINTDPIDQDGPDGQDDWQAHVLPWVQVFIESQLGVARADIADEVLRRRGRVWFDRTHIDVELPLQDVSLAVRVAGFDLDPGWVPSLGRVINFHFE